MRNLSCGHPPSEHGEHDTGYGLTPKGKKICYACCAEDDKKQMRKDGRITLYLSPDPAINAEAWKLTNWPGSLRFALCRMRIGRHNIAGKRYDAWFMFEGATWHAVTLATIRRLPIAGG